MDMVVEKEAPVAVETGTILVVDDDKPFRERLSRFFERQGFDVVSCTGVVEARAQAAQLKPAFAVVDMRLDDGNGVDLVEELRAIRADMRVVILTAYGNLASAVAAIRTGAVDYLAKPADPEDVVKSLTADRGERPEPPENPMSADRVRWEHIQRVYELCNRNVSETARRLNMHRRTLQRILAKRSPR
ncbi:ActR/PrrA/RegA family redox response regulator transcription factor [Rhodothalassium salexigens]|uniref:ActR/PrrA/RegA family redox response regulator transcription factor n=1 Tax=Rhodothalassium salexigens TaxID=1086 RepID=UPI00237A110C|nr:ActR/PrrA/RegA family redox response regulator transcription factor [Rhodothalassium salexigens]